MWIIESSHFPKSKMSMNTHILCSLYDHKMQNGLRPTLLEAVSYIEGEII